MGNVAPPEALLLRWTEIINDPTLRDLPYKIELNAWGKIEMSPASNRRGHLQSLVSAEIQRQLRRGVVLTEASILTIIGVRVPDVVWCSPEFFQRHGYETPYLRAPELCIEIVSPSNTPAELEEKSRAYFQAGATEVWHVLESGAVRYFGADGELAASVFSVELTLPPLV